MFAQFKDTNNFRSHILSGLIGNLYHRNTFHLCYILWNALSSVLRHVCAKTAYSIPNTHTQNYSFRRKGED